MEELTTKANRAWFSISNIFYQKKRMSPLKALRIFDSLVTPVSLYSCEFWLPFNLPAFRFVNLETLLKAWEGFLPETINQRMCLMLLGVHKNASSLAILGELNRYPIFIKALAQFIKYEHMVTNKADPDSLIALALVETKDMNERGIDCWLSRVSRIKSILGLKDYPRHVPPKFLGKKIMKFLKNKF